MSDIIACSVCFTPKKYHKESWAKNHKKKKFGCSEFPQFRKYPEHIEVRKQINELLKQYDEKTRGYISPYRGTFRICKRCNDWVDVATPCPNCYPRKGLPSQDSVM